jgi:hypothetical protein
VCSIDVGAKVETASRESLIAKFRCPMQKSLPMVFVSLRGHAPRKIWQEERDNRGKASTQSKKQGVDADVCACVEQYLHCLLVTSC